MSWIVLVIIFIVVGWYIYDKKKGSITLSREQAEMVLQMSRKERYELAVKMQDVVDKGAIQGEPISIDKAFVVTEYMTEDIKREMERFKQEMFEKYGPTIPVNTAHRIVWELEGKGQMWSDEPGCFERHLQRREGNLLFSVERRIVTRKDFEEAKEKDAINYTRLIEKFESLVESIRSSEKNITPTQAHNKLKEIQDLIEEAVSIGGDIENIVNVLEGLEKTLIQTLNKIMPEGADDLAQLNNLSSINRIPYFAQVSMEGSPIPKEEQLSSLLSEDLGTIALAGYMSRAFSPNYRPNESDVIDLLDKVKKDGFSENRTSKIIAAWNEKKIAS